VIETGLSPGLSVIPVLSVFEIVRLMLRMPF
jgi:hypothetical protein